METEIQFPDAEKGYVCPCCGQFVKVYCRHFNSNMGIALIVLYRNRGKGFVHLENLLSAEGYKRCGDASYLKHYKLIEPLDKERSDGSKRNGHYKITGLGILFVENKITIKERFKMYNNKCEGFEGKDVNIFDVLGKKFDYNQLMHQTQKNES